MCIGLFIVSVYLFLLPYFKVNKDYQRCVTPSFAQFAHSIDVKKRFFTFFLFWSRFYVLTYFYLPNVFVILKKKRWQSLERQAD